MAHRSVALAAGGADRQLAPAFAAGKRRSLPARVPDELLPLLSLCRSLLSQGDVPARDQPWPPIRQTLLLLAAGDRQRLWQTLSAQTALCKRTHATLSAAAAYAIMEDALGEEGETILS